MIDKVTVKLNLNITVMKHHLQTWDLKWLQYRNPFI